MEANAYEINAATSDFILRHADDDVRQLALRPAPAGVDLRAALQQIEGRQLAARKMAFCMNTDGFLFPPRLSLEQCSSEQAASYKRKVAERLMASFLKQQGKLKHTFFCDLTGGFGIDFMTIAPLFDHTTYMERNAELCQLARHNLPLVGLSQAEVICAEAETVLNEGLSELTLSADSFIFLMLDPARRDTAGRKVARIEDCTPDVCALQSQLRSRAHYILLKLSPMLDLTAALRTLCGVVEVHIVCLDGECKELLLVMAGEAMKPFQALEPSIEDVPIYCIDVGQPMREKSFSEVQQTAFRFTLREEREEAVSTAFLPVQKEGDGDFRLPTYLYEPDASLMKAGAFRTICQRFPVQKLASDTHLYVSDALIPQFPGRCWHILDHSSFSKKDLKRLLNGITSADLTVRGFPVSVATLRKQLHLREGGTVHFLATTLSNGAHILLRLERSP